MKRLTYILLWATLIVGIWKFDDISDWWWLRNYQPSSEIAELAENIALTDTGRDILYLGDPKLSEKASFSEDCPFGEASESLVLGCYNAGKIFILRVEKPEIKKIMEVTAAHEMLHAAYAELPATEKNKINTMVDEFYRSIESKNPDLQNIVAEYAKSEPGQRFNELHSLLPTQIGKLSPELEDYYSRYFSSRHVVVEAYNSYEAVFANLRSQINSLKDQIKSLKSQIAQTESSINSKQAELTSTRNQMDARLASGDTAGYNQLVPVHNRLVAEYNSLITRYKELVAVHNQKVEAVNTLALEQSQLVEALDSTKFTPL